MRYRAARAIGVLFLTVLCRCGKSDAPSVGSTSSAAAPKGFNGRFRAITATGTVVLGLAESQGVVLVEANGETIRGRVTSPGKAEGGDDNGRFELELRGETLVARFRVKTPSGEFAELPEMTLERFVPSPEGGSRDAELAGHWMHTKADGDVGNLDPSLNGGTSYARDEHLVLEADGAYVTWRLEIGRRGGEAPNRIRGAWKTDDRMLYLKPEGASDWTVRGRYARSENLMMLTNAAGEKQVFNRE